MACLFFRHGCFFQVNQATGQRVPSMCPPNPPSSDTIDDNLGVHVTEEDADGAYRPIDTARVRTVQLLWLVLVLVLVVVLVVVVVVPGSVTAVGVDGGAGVGVVVIGGGGGGSGGGGG